MSSFLLRADAAAHCSVLPCSSLGGSLPAFSPNPRAYGAAVASPSSARWRRAALRVRSPSAAGVGGGSAVLSSNSVQVILLVFSSPYLGGYGSPLISFSSSDGSSTFWASEPPWFLSSFRHGVARSHCRAHYSPYRERGMLQRGWWWASPNSPSPWPLTRWRFPVHMQANNDLYRVGDFMTKREELKVVKPSTTIERGGHIFCFISFISM